MADNKYENQFCFVDSSIIISNFSINYYIMARHKMSSIRNTKTDTHTSIWIIFYVTQEVGPVFLKSGLKLYIQQMTLPSQVLCGI